MRGGAVNPEGKLLMLGHALAHGAQLGDGPLAPEVARVGDQLHPDRAAREGVAQHQQLALGIDRPAAHVRMQEGRADLYAAVGGPDVQVAGAPDHAAVRSALDGVGDQFTLLVLAQVRLPRGVEGVALAGGRQQRPGLGIAIHGGAHRLLQLGRDGKQPHEAALEGKGLQVHGDA